MNGLNVSRRSELRQEALERAGYECEWPACTTWTGLQMAHYIPIGAGGTSDPYIDSLANVCILCQFHHNVQEGEAVPGRKRQVTDLLRSFIRTTYFD